MKIIFRGLPQLNRYETKANDYHLIYEPRRQETRIRRIRKYKHKPTENKYGHTNIKFRTVKTFD